MADEVSIPKTKPKRELTEAQKLAFLKGREKRLANIEKKRLEKEEAAETVAKIVTPKTSPPPTPKPEPDTIPETQPAPVESFNFDMDALADKVAERILKAQPPPPVPAPKPKAAARPRPPQQFTWL